MALPKAGMLRSRKTRPLGLPVACPVCACERIDTDGRGINCICSRCSAEFSPQLGIQAFRHLMEPLTGGRDDLELGDVITFTEDPDARPFWIWER